MPGRRPGQVRDDFTGEPFGSGEGMNFDDAARGLAELEFDARVALPEAQERFKRAEAKIADLMEELELAAELGRQVGLEADRYRKTLETIAVGRRPDGSWNRDREACRQLAEEALNA